MGSGLPDHRAGRSSENPANLASWPLWNVPRSFAATMPQTRNGYSAGRRVATAFVIGDDLEVRLVLGDMSSADVQVPNAAPRLPHKGCDARRR
jgi:hypothetical protein